MLAHDTRRAWTGSTSPPAPMASVPRRCACGGTIGPDGMCDTCRRRTLQRKASAPGAGPAPAPPAVHQVLRSPGQPLDTAVHAKMEPRFRHSFAEVRVHADRRAAGEQVLCDAPMGSSRCNLPGSAPIINNTNPHCTRVCTQLHEMKHVSDWGPCCARARAAFQAPGADQAAVQARWNDYMDRNRAWFECRAYQRSVQCADVMRALLLCPAPARVLRWVARGVGALGGGVAGAQIAGMVGAATGAGAGLGGGPLAPATVPAGAAAGFVTGEVLGLLTGASIGAMLAEGAEVMRERCCERIAEYEADSVRGRTVNCDRAGPPPVCPF
ncbi:MAG TPA: DUF4157 domain-containing protein [Longimicrobium sp.]|nr:DUF4157 domain-containing protein [Longimicrobium sp.]